MSVSIAVGEDEKMGGSSSSGHNKHDGTPLPRGPPGCSVTLILPLASISTRSLSPAASWGLRRVEHGGLDIGPGASGPAVERAVCPQHAPRGLMAPSEWYQQNLWVPDACLVCGVHAAVVGGGESICVPGVLRVRALALGSCD